MRKQIVFISLLSLFLILFTSAAFAYFKSSVTTNCTDVLCHKKASAKTAETLWEVLTKQIIGSVSL